jgi:V8-like Glu-specific endopeptidase
MATRGRTSADEELEVESPFLDRELFVTEADEAAEPRATALAGWSPFQAGLPPAREDESLFEGQGGITADDDRQEVGDTTIVPYKWICSLTYEKDGKTLDGGTGFLISDRHVLTAGHVISQAGLNGPYPPTLAVYPGRHYGGEPFGRFEAGNTRVSGNNLDFGLITLRAPVDPRMLWWGHPASGTDWWTEALIPLRQLRLAALPVTTAGYPGAKDSYRRRMYVAQGETLPATFGVQFSHTADTTEGQSGSPIWLVRGGRFVLLGIATSYGGTSQHGLLLHDGLVRRRVAQWMADDAPKPKPRRIPLELPHRWVCRLEVRDNDLKRTVGHGTGVMISNQHVLTSARVIHGFVKDRRRYSIRIWPGYEFGKEALGSTTASSGRVSPAFSPDIKDAAEDYGLLTMSRPLGSRVFSALGKKALGSWGDASHGYVKTDKDWNGQAAHVAAFSRLSGGGGGYHRLRVATGAILRRQGGALLHDASQRLDAPGAPIWVAAGPRRLLAGIATSLFSKESGTNWGCYLSPATQKQITEWIAADQANRELEAPEEEAAEGWLEVDEGEAAEPELSIEELENEELENEELENEELENEELENEEAEEEEEEEGQADEEGEEPELEEDSPKTPAPASGKWLTPLAVKETTIPKYKGRTGPAQSTGCAIYLPAAASKKATIDLLVFFHGDKEGCPTASFDPDPSASKKKFGLDAQVEASGRAIALAVPQMHWRGRDTSEIKGKWSAANFNQFVEDVLAEIGSQTSQKRTLGQLIIAGHSRAYNILTPLALEFHLRAPATTEKGRPLQQLAEVWSLDANYDVRDVRGLDVWASARPTGRFVAVHSREIGHAVRWATYFDGWALLPNLKGCLVDETHCVIPTKYVQNLLATKLSSPNWCKP